MNVSAAFRFGGKSRRYEAALFAGLVVAVLGSANVNAAVAGKRSGSALPRQLSVHIVYQPKNAHAWTVNGSERSAVRLHAGGSVVIVNDDLRPHRLMIGGDAKVVLAGSPVMDYVGARVRVIFPKPGVYELTTIFGSPYIDDIKVVGPPATLRLKLTVH
jgi:hypothetical protein